MRQERAHEQQGDHAHRQVDEEHQPPAAVLGQHAAERRADNIRQRERRTDEHQPAQPKLRVGEKIGDGGEHRADQDAAANPLQAARDHEEQHVGRHAAHDRRDGEEDDRGDQERLAAEQVAQAARRSGMVMTDVSM